MATVQDVKNHLTGMLHAGSSLKKVRNFYHALERAANNTLANIKPVDSERTAALTSLIYDEVYDYPLPSDFGWPIDLKPQGERDNIEVAKRRFAEPFDFLKELEQKTISIEGNEGTKVLRTNWRGNAPILVDSMNAVGDWAAAGSASGLKAQELHKISGNASLEFDVTATNDGIQNTALDTINLTDEDEIADMFAWLNIPTAADLANFNSITAYWGNDLTANYWQGAAETDQADGSAFKVGWNLIKWLWSDATETGTVAPATIDSVQFLVNVDAAINNLRIDNPVFVVGRNFDLKYYSAYAFKNSAGTYLQRPTDDGDTVIFSNIAFQIFLEECRKECAAQIEGEDSAFDIRFANARLYGNPDS